MQICIVSNEVLKCFTHIMLHPIFWSDPKTAGLSKFKPEEKNNKGLL